MMMIQASDNQNLIQSAYEAAHKITDENVKAQALLDVVNEINYFTHQPESWKNFSHKDFMTVKAVSLAKWNFLK